MSKITKKSVTRSKPNWITQEGYMFIVEEPCIIKQCPPSKNVMKVVLHSMNWGNRVIWTVKEEQIAVIKMSCKKEINKYDGQIKTEK